MFEAKEMNQLLSREPDDFIGGKYDISKVLTLFFDSWSWWSNFIN